MLAGGGFAQVLQAFVENSGESGLGSLIGDLAPMVKETIGNTFDSESIQSRLKDVSVPLQLASWV